MQDPIFAFARHVTATPGEAIPEAARVAARTFILDTLGVGIGGRSGPKAQDLVMAAQSLGSGEDARIWATGERLPAPMAAMCNAYQAHCQEYDCVHEPAVAHVVTAILPAALAHAERVGGVSGRALTEAVILGVDVAAGLGVAAVEGLRFFRPGTVGAFGSVAALGRLMNFDEDRMVAAFSLAYGQVCGTMQAHTEGSGLLAMQMAFNARNGVTAAMLAEAGFDGPLGVLEGDFGYFRLIENGGDLGPVIDSLGTTWRITEVAHKPWPSGRATHGILDACLALQTEHGFSAGDVAAIDLTVPPLIQHLVGRPPRSEMAINYARLSARYVVASALHGPLSQSDFTDAAYARADVQNLAQRVTLTVRDGDDPNALVPIDAAVRLRDGRTLEKRVVDVYGAPENAMTHEAQIAKLVGNCADAPRPLSPERAARLAGSVAELESLEDVRALVDLAIAP